MPGYVKTILIAALVLATAWAGLDSGKRRLLMLPVAVATIELPAPRGADAEEPDTRWFDDYYTLTAVDADTTAIGEPLGSQQNYNYLIAGTTRALLFDSGAGTEDVRPVVDALTNLPVTAVASHLHYDHIGKHGDFERVAVADLPHLRRRAGDGPLVPTLGEHLGFVEGIERPELRVTEWLGDGEKIDLGGRTLEVIHTPGHTRDSISLFDAERNQLFTGDFITEGPVFYFLPGSSVGDALATSRSLLDRIDDETLLLTAHRLDPPGIPVLHRSDLVALHEALRGMREGELRARGFWPVEYRDGDRYWILADFAWSRSWD